MFPKNEPPFSVLIPDGESEFALFVVHCLAPFPNVRVHVLSAKQWSPIRFSRYCYSFTSLPINLSDPTYLDRIATIVKKLKIDVILPTSTQWISFAIANHKTISELAAVVPLPDERMFEIANNKWKLAQFLDQNKIPGPATILVTDHPSFESQLDALQFPVLLKPVTAWGGEGIKKFVTPSELRQFLDQHRPVDIYERFVVQSFLPGNVVGVNVLSDHGKTLATTMQRGIIPNTQKYAAAGAIEFIKDEKFLDFVNKLISELDWTGFANIDTLLDNRDKQLKILEINARMWGSLRGSLLAGVNFPYLACLAALNIPFPQPDYNLVRYFHSLTALKESFSRPLGKNREKSFAIRETGLKFLLNDPLAEAIRGFRQQVLEK